jgi:hypothetical protein
MERAFRRAGARTRQVIFRNRSREDIAASIGELASAIGEAQILALSGRTAPVTKHLVEEGARRVLQNERWLSFCLQNGAIMLTMTVGGRQFDVSVSSDAVKEYAAAHPEAVGGGAAADDGDARTMSEFEKSWQALPREQKAQLARMQDDGCDLALALQCYEARQHNVEATRELLASIQ